MVDTPLIPATPGEALILCHANNYKTGDMARVLLMLFVKPPGNRRALSTARGKDLRLMLDLAREDFESVRDVIRDTSGIWLSDDKNTYLRVRLTHRLEVTGMQSIEEYYLYLRYDTNRETELSHLIDAVAVNETHFFREYGQLLDFSNRVVPGMLAQKKNGDALRIWSAGCSNGAEPYTLAMILLEHPEKIAAARIEITATDISNHALASAREAVYDQHVVRHVPPPYLQKYFIPDGNGEYALGERVKQMVDFSRVNLIDPLQTGLVNEVDCIFCRNVLMYFEGEQRNRCCCNLHRALSDGGFLFLGHAETMNGITGLFDVSRLGGSVAYRKLVKERATQAQAPGAAPKKMVARYYEGG